MKSKNLKPNDSDEVKLLKAARSGDIKLLRDATKKISNLDLLVQDKSLEYRTALMWAADRGHLDSLQFLLAAGASPRIKGKHPYYAEAQRNTALHFAAQKGREAICQLLIDSGAVVDAKNSHKATPLICAIANGRLKIVRLLVENGADLSKRNNTALTRAIHVRNTFINDRPICSEADWEKMVLFLIENDADIESADSTGHTSLMSACSDLKLTRILIDHGANVNARTKRGWTPLMGAANARAYESVKLFLQAGANPAVKNSEGRTALDIAQRTKDRRTIKLLS